MATLFTPEVTHSYQQDAGKLRELDSHQLLSTDKDTGITTFDDVRTVGELFLSQTYNSVLRSDRELPSNLLQRHLLDGGGTFLAKLQLGITSADTFPATVEPVYAPDGTTQLRVHFMPIPFSQLEHAQFSPQTDSLLALAAAAAVAPQFMLALNEGLATTNCASKSESVTTLKPDHGTPLVVTFDSFNTRPRPVSAIDTVLSVTQNPDITIKQAAHLHGQNQANISNLARPAGESGVGAGVPVYSKTRAELPPHALHYSTVTDENGQIRIVGLSELQSQLRSTDLSLIAVALGFTAKVVGDSANEKVIERILQPANAATPLRSLI
ncbi:MAG: hypothetical protein M3Q81_01875 [bacterium]|nr:hypothetical protein [bacterium]